MGQLLSKHMKTCKGLTKTAVDTVTTDNKDGTVTSSSQDGATTSPEKKKKKHRSKDLPSDSQPPPQSSQVSSQTSPHHSECTKKKSPPQHPKSLPLAARVPARRRRNAPPATNTVARASPAGTSPTRTNPARTNPTRTSTMAKTSLVRISQARRRSKVASPDMGGALAMSPYLISFSCRLSNCLTAPCVTHAIFYISLF